MKYEKPEIEIIEFSEEERALMDSDPEISGEDFWSKLNNSDGKD